MALSIDLSRALRTQAELTALAEAVWNAPSGEPETDSVEWKSDWDLTAADVRFETARHLLGFGNRTVFAAESQFEGCAYLLAGVEPRNLVGVDVLDPATIDDQLSKYVSPGQPRWTPNYVTLDGKSVLVLTVEAPRAGDAIFTLQKGFAGWPAGRVFVRRHGKTEEGGPADIRTLEARGQAARPRIELNVGRADEILLRAVDVSDDDCHRWLSAERARLMQPFAPPTRATAVDFLTNSIYARPAMPRLTIASDTRSREEYQEEVGAYLGSGANYWRATIATLAIQRNLAPVLLEVRNPTERNFDGVEVVVDVPPDVQAWVTDDEPHEVFDAPTPPELWNQKSIAMLRVPRLKSLRPHAEIERDSVGSRIRFAPHHVRPGETVRLRPVHLVVPASGEVAPIRLRWRLTSTGADGWRDGEVLYEVDSQPVRLVAPAGDVSLLNDD